MADYLARKGIPFRLSHEITGKIVSYAEEKGRVLTNLHISEYQMFSKEFGDDLFEYITLDGSIESRKSYGGTARQNVVSMIEKAKTEIAKW